MEGPASEREAVEALLELIQIKNRHASYCEDCLDRQNCDITNMWDTAIAAAAALAETAKVVDGDGT